MKKKEEAAGCPPLLSKIRRYQSGQKIALNMPGHKGKVPGDFSFWGARLWADDVTEIPPLADGEAIRRAEEEMAALTGAGRAYFLWHGGTGGLQAAVLAACRKPGEEVILPRYAHVSLWRALALADAVPVWLPLRRHPQWGTPLGVAQVDLQKAISDHPGAAAAIFIHPSYQGLVTDLPALVREANQAGLYTIVDEAHGAHLLWHKDLPTATSAGADVTVQSWHKTMGSLTQTAVLLQNNQDLPVERYLELLSTTSPSYLLAASLDAARFLWRQEGEQLMANIKACRELLLERFSFCRSFTVLSDKWLPPVCGFDPAKLQVASGLGHNGLQLASALDRAGLSVEMAEEKSVLLLLGAGDRPENYQGLLDVLFHAEEILAGIKPRELPVFTYTQPKALLTPGEALRAKREWVPLRHSYRRVAADCITPYPPGIPLLGLGEVIDKDMLEIIRRLSAVGVHFCGLRDGLVPVVK